MVRAGGGFSVEIDDPIMIRQIQLTHVDDAGAAAKAILGAKDEILAMADRAVPGLAARGGGARGLVVRTLGGPEDRMIVTHVLVDCRDAMGANLINTVAEAVADRLAALAKGKVGLRILSNLCDKRCVRVRCCVPADVLATDVMDGSSVIDGIVNASRFAELDPYRAATHNKGIMNGIDAVVIATGNDWRAVEAGAHAFAARGGRYAPLSIWRREGDTLVGFLELPLALGTVGGTLRVRNLVAPPELARDAPGLDVLHPVVVGILPVVRHEFGHAVAHRRDRGSGQGLGIDEPLVSQHRLDHHLRAVAIGRHDFFRFHERNQSRFRVFARYLRGVRVGGGEGRTPHRVARPHGRGSPAGLPDRRHGQHDRQHR
jgi:hypothetical protein